MTFRHFFSKPRHWVIIALISLSSVASFGFWGDDKDFEIAKNLDIYYTLFRELNMYYVDELEPGDLVKTSIDQMLKSLDPYTVYIPESKIEDYKVMTTGQYGGIGVVVNRREAAVIVAEIYEGSPADKAGLKVGDRVLEIGGNSTKGKNLSQIGEFLNGQSNTEVALLIERPGTNQPIEKNVLREEIKIKNVPYYGVLDGKIGYISLTGFMRGAAKEVKNAFYQLQGEHGIESLILDLRGNPGGLLTEAVEIVNIFVEKGEEIVSTRGKVGKWKQIFKASSQPVDLEIPLVVLINSRSASASEIVSGALQDLDRAVIVGQRSFGKGLVQTTRPLSYNAQLKLTVAKYYIPSGRCIQALDYSNRREDGSVGKVPDSLVSKFTTSRGRIVYDGGGIRPDLEVEPRKLSNVAASLLRQNLIFDYATLFVLRHDSIGAPEKFSISRKEYQNFLAFLDEKQFDYDTQREETFDKLVELSKKEKYYEIAENEFDALEKKLAHDKQRDLKNFQAEISEILAEEIASRYYYQAGRVRSALAKDPEVKKATQVLADQSTYQSYLKPK